MATQYQTAKTGCARKTWTYTFTVMSRTLLPIKLLRNNGVEDRVWTYVVPFGTADLQSATFNRSVTSTWQGIILLSIP